MAGIEALTLKLLHTGQAVYPEHNELEMPYAHNYRAFWEWIADGLKKENHPYAAEAQEKADYYALYDAVSPPSDELQAMFEHMDTD